VVCCGGAFAAVTVLAPTLYPWYALTPLAVLGCCVDADRARRWLAVVTAVLTLLVLPNGLGLAVLTKGPGAVADAVLVAVLIWVWVRRRRRRRDRVYSG
jgi:hypothetical protein